MILEAISLFLPSQRSDHAPVFQMFANVLTDVAEHVHRIGERPSKSAQAPRIVRV
ncbi:MAG: hypothetical protein AAGA88_06825 [Pseudomonadota bacterium]